MIHHSPHGDVTIPQVTLTEHVLAGAAGAATRSPLLLTPIWLMLGHTGGYLWPYPAEDLLPLVLLAIVPAGQAPGLRPHPGVPVRLPPAVRRPRAEMTAARRR